MSSSLTLRASPASIRAGLTPRRARPLAARRAQPVTAALKPQEDLQAVVLGGGIAGLLTAHVLSARFDRVILVDKDCLQGGRVEHETFKEVSFGGQNLLGFARLEVW